MKRDSSTSSTILAAPTTAFEGLFVTNFTIAHNLGFIPFFRVAYEPFNDGVIWPALGSKLQGSATNPRNTATTGPGLIVWAPDVNNLKIQIYYTSNSLGHTVPLYWVISKDFAL